MIQRIQTLLWAVAAILLCMIVGMPYATVSIPQSAEAEELFVLGPSSPALAEVIEAEGGLFAATAVPLAALIPLCIVLSIAAVLLFKKPQWQIRLGVIAIVLELCLVGLMWYSLEGTKQLLGEGTIGRLGVAAYIPLLAVALGYMAIRGVIRDRNHIRRMNRLR